MAVLCRERKWIFIDIPRTGSTSVRASMAYGGYKLEEILTPHTNAVDVQEAVGGEVWNSYFKFGFTRDLETWMPSYKFWLGDGSLKVTGQFFNWEQFPMDWFLDEEKNLIINKVYRLEEMGAAMKELGMPVFHEHKRVLVNVTA